MSEEVFVIAKLKIQFHGPVISEFNGDKIVGTFHEKELQMTNQKEFTKEFKRKENKL